MKEIYWTELVVAWKQIDIKQFYHEEKEKIDVYHYYNKELEVYWIWTTIKEAYITASRSNYEMCMNSVIRMYTRCK